MVSEYHFYNETTPGFREWYTQWWVLNCEKCPFSSHLDPSQSNGRRCLAEQKENILSQKSRSQVYIAIDYHKNQKGKICLLKQALKVDES